MPDNKPFFDTNIFVYLLLSNSEKTPQAEETVRRGGHISVQVLNELVNVAIKKCSVPWDKIHEFLELIKLLCSVESLTVETHNKGLYVAERYGFSVYDSMIVAAALNAGCKVLYSEDMQDGQLIEDQLRTFNPFS